MGIEVVWKPVGWWVKDKWPTGRGFVVDGFITAQPDKKHHEWEQDLSWSEYCMKFVYPDNIVLDPCFGSGTLGISCRNKGVNFIGIDVDEVACETARQRLGL